MTKANKQRLIDLKMKDLKVNHPNVPEKYIPQPKYSDSTANGLTKCIKDFLNLSGHQAERINSMGRVINTKKGVDWYTGKSVGGAKYIPGTSTKGTADISATINGKSVKIEVKFGKDRQSEVQKSYQEAVERAGGVYFIAKNFDDFIYFYDNYKF